MFFGEPDKFDDWERFSPLFEVDEKNAGVEVKEVCAFKF